WNTRLDPDPRDRVVRQCELLHDADRVHDHVRARDRYRALERLVCRHIHIVDSRGVLVEAGNVGNRRPKCAVDLELPARHLAHLVTEHPGGTKHKHSHLNSFYRRPPSERSGLTLMPGNELGRSGTASIEAHWKLRFPDMISGSTTETLRDACVLVTGGTGSLGQALVERLVGANVREIRV